MDNTDLLKLIYTEINLYGNYYSKHMTLFITNQSTALENSKYVYCKLNYKDFCPGWPCFDLLIVSLAHTCSISHTIAGTSC